MLKTFNEKTNDLTMYPAINVEHMVKIRQKRMELEGYNTSNIDWGNYKELIEKKINIFNNKIKTYENN